jgi:hypothetical protein
VVHDEPTECRDVAAFSMRGAQPEITGYRYLISQGYEPPR